MCHLKHIHVTIFIYFNNNYLQFLGVMLVKITVFVVTYEILIV
jgi:hypothetical protein